MSDNTTTYKPDGSPDDLISSDALTTLNGASVSDGQKVQRVKLGFGAEGELRDVESSHPMPVVDSDVAATLLAVKTLIDALNAKVTAVNTGAIGGTVALDVATLAELESINANTGLAQPLTDAQLRAAAVPVSNSTLAATIKQKNVASALTDYGIVLLAQRRDADTAETTGDGQYTPLKQDQAGRLKVATQPGDVSALAASITAAGQSVAIQTTRISNLSIAMVATSLVGHNAIFEVSNDSTNGTDGNWKTVQAARTDSNTIETTTGVLAATPAYAWELNVASYSYFRVRATAHTSGTAAYTLKPGTYATEPVPSSQNPALVGFNYSQSGVIAINTDLLVIDCQSFKSLSIQCASMGTSGVITPAWSNDGTNWVTATLLSETGASSTTFSAACLRNVNVLARYFRLRLTTATTAGTTTLVVQASQATLAPIIATRPVSFTQPALVAGTALIGTAPAPLPTAVADVASAAITATATTSAMTPSWGSAYEVNIPVTAVSGTSPTLDVVVQESDDGGTNWFDVWHFPRITATGMYRSPKLPLTGNRIRYVQTVGGSSPSFTRAINRLQSSETVAPIRQLLDRAIVLTTPNSTTASLQLQGARNVQLAINIGAAITAPALQLEGSDDNGSTWYAVGSPLTAVASSTVQVTINNVAPQMIRARVSTVGATVSAGFVLIKGY